MANRPTMIRMPDRTRALIDAIRDRTGMTITQVIIQAVECLAKQYKIILP